AAITEAHAKVRHGYPWWLRAFLMRGVLAITLGRRIYVAADVAEEHLEQLLRHELVHVQQIARVGMLRFYWRYVAEFIALRRGGLSTADAYRNISFEKEALAAEKNPIIA
ncbi:MAG TPA: DUF4157 domain-containing protein, partial [Thermoanaerobaculia bacterium]